MTTPNMTTSATYDADVLANASRFAVSLFLGRGKYANAESGTLEGIKEAAEKLVAENPNATAKPIIVAFDEAGNQAPLGARAAKAKPAKKPAKAKAEKPVKAKAAPKAKAEKVAKPVKAEKPAKAEKAVAAAKPVGKRAEAMENAAKGILPAAPDFSANTHKPFRKKLADLVAMVEASDIKGLKAYTINPVSSSPKALDKFRNLAVMALEAQRKAAKKS